MTKKAMSRLIWAGIVAGANIFYFLNFLLF